MLNMDLVTEFDDTMVKEYFSKDKVCSYPDVVVKIDSQDIVVDGDSKFGLVHYFLNNGVIINDFENKDSFPVESFHLFKDCYGGNNKETWKYLESAFEIIREDSDGIKNEDGDGLDGLTIASSDSIDLGDNSFPKIQLFPKLLHVRNYSGKPEVVHLLNNHTNCLRVLFDKNKKKLVTNLFLNVKKILQSYIEILVKDVVNKWIQWLKVIQKIDLTKRVSPRILNKRINNLFWRRYFVLSGSSVHSINYFTDKFRSYMMKQDIKNDPLKFGLWWDEINDIIIFSNCYPSKNMPMIQKESLIVPTSGIILSEEENSQYIVQKLLLFMNFAIVECLKHELNY